MTKPYTKTTLGNGAMLIQVPMHETKAATLLVFYPVGSRYESDELAGGSHFIEHLMFKGTTRRPDTTHISRELDSVGAEYNAFTSKDHTGYYIKVSSEHVPLACDMLSDMLGHSLFEQKEVDRERGVIIEEIHMYEDNPMMHLDDVFEEVLFPGSTLGRNIAGSEGTMSAMPRDQVMAYRDRFYRPSLMTVILAGKLPKDVVALVEKTFGAMQDPKTPPAPTFETLAVSAERYAKPDLKLKKKDTEQVNLALGFPSYAHGDKRLPALTLLSTILGGNMSSRLFIQVRERRGLCYHVRAGASPYQDVGAFMISSGLVKNRVEEAIGVILDEVRKLRDGGVTPEELRSAKEYVRGKLVLSLEETSEVADWYGRQYLFKKEMDTPEEKMTKFDAVTREDVQAVAKDLFRNERLRMAMIGPFDDAEPFRKLLVL